MTDKACCTETAEIANTVNQYHLIEPLVSDIADRPDMTTVKIADLKILAKGQLEYHRGEGSCKDCPHYYKDGTDSRCNTTGELTCCHCYACKLARSILRA